MSIGTVAEAAEYLLVQTRQGDTVDLFLRDALTLVGAGHRVRLLVVGDGIGVAVGRTPQVVTDYLAAGGELWVDDFTLVQRAIPLMSLVAGATVVGMEKVAQLLGDERVRAVWH
jgi:hypothetical protein